MEDKQKEKVREIINSNLDGDDPLSAAWITDDGIRELCEYFKALWQVKEQDETG